MAANQMLLLVVMILLVHGCACLDVELTVNPETLSLSPSVSSTGELVTLKCKQTGDISSNDKMDSIYIKRFVDGTTEPQGDLVAIADRDGIRVDPALSQEVTASGGISEKILTVTIPTADCKDMGNYTCYLTVKKGGLNPLNFETTKKLSVEATPGAILLSLSQSGITHWKVNSSLTLTCNGRIGTIDNNDQIEWRWQYRIAESGSSWTTITQGPDYTITDKKIVSDIPNEGDCEIKRQTSEMTRILSLEDTGRVYRCFVHRNGRDFTEFAANYSVGTVTEEGLTTTTAGPSDDGGASKADVGPIIGAVFGVLIVIIVVIIIVVVIVKRRRANKDTSNEDEGGDDKPAGGPASDPYAPDPTVTYSQPNRHRHEREPRGMTNKAMDEVEDKTPPYDSRLPRYANDFHQGRRNKGYDYDANGRGGPNHSSEDDGTDSRVNTSQHSAGEGDPTIGTAI